MACIELRNIAVDESPSVHRVFCTAFGEDVHHEETVYSQLGFDFERSVCAFENGRPIGTSTSLTLELTVPGGGRIPTGGYGPATFVADFSIERARAGTRQAVDEPGQMVMLESFEREGGLDRAAAAFKTDAPPYCSTEF